ncbi:hypothetical protein QR685DRAFT_449490 [Neurospora intermedia]|uniref:Uncharacterized protein n=1 Tax=Neurospora intermedia TaxID=5142 RepID=A0ABR3D3N2_NEUIN
MEWYMGSGSSVVAAYLLGMFLMYLDSNGLSAIVYDLPNREETFDKATPRQPRQSQKVAR